VRRRWSAAAATGNGNQRQRVVRGAVTRSPPDPQPHHRHNNEKNGDRHAGEYDCALFLHLVS
jgi:hypothetical protein